MLKDYALQFSPLWYTGEVTSPDVDIPSTSYDEFAARIENVAKFLNFYFNHYSSYYLAVAYKNKAESHLKFNDTYYVVNSSVKGDLLKVMEYFLGLPIGTKGTDFYELMEAYYCNALKVKYKE